MTHVNGEWLRQLIASNIGAFHYSRIGFIHNAIYGYAVVMQPCVAAQKITVLKPSIMLLVRFIIFMCEIFHTVAFCSNGSEADAHIMAVLLMNYHRCFYGTWCTLIMYYEIFLPFYAIFSKKNTHIWSTDSCMGVHASYLRSIMSV